jgi:hypothetical protein
MTAAEEGRNLMLVKKIWAGLALCGVLLAGGAAAHAESPEALYKRGVELRKAGQDEAAIEVFKQLNNIDSSPRNVAQLGLAEQAVGLWVDAEGHVKEALKSAGNPWIKKNRDSLVSALVHIQERLGWVEIHGAPVDAEVLVDGKLVGRLPLEKPIRVVVGSIPITVRAADHLERSTVVVVGPNATVRERFVLQPAAPRAPTVAVANVPQAPPPAVEPPPVVPVSAPDVGEPPPRASALRLSAKWIAFGAAVPAAALGVVGLVREGSAANDFNASCGIAPSGAPTAVLGSGKTDADCASLKSKDDSAFRLEVIGLSAAAVLVAAGALSWMTEPSSAPQRTPQRSVVATSLACVPGLSQGGVPSVGCALRF